MGNKIYIGSDIYIELPSDEIRKWVMEHLEFRNPEYTRRYRMGLWTKNTPARIMLYHCEENGDLRVPFGCLTQLPLVHNEEIFTRFHPKKTFDFGAEIPLYPYQEKAVKQAYDRKFGLILAPTGSGKTQMGIALATMWKSRTLWLTHTTDLIDQSKSRAERYLGRDKVGKITTDTKALHSHKCFYVATIQTMYRMDPKVYKDWFDVVIVDECHHAAGTYDTITMYEQVLSNLNARHKYGLTATLYRSDGLVGTAKMLLGDVCAEVDKNDCGDTIMRVGIKEVDTSTILSHECLNTDGTIDYVSTISYLCRNQERNELIIKHILAYADYSSLLLTSRVEHMETLYNMMPEWLQKKTAIVHGKIKKSERQEILNKMRLGELNILLGTYSLAKEGLDIPRLERLYLAIPQKDYGVITQCIGRIARKEEKRDPICVDFVDININYFYKTWQRRKTIYKKNNCYLLKGEDE